MLGELNDRERLAVGYPEFTVRQLAPMLAVSPSQSHVIRSRAAEIIRVELVDDDDAEGVALLVMELGRNFAADGGQRRRVRRSGRAMSVFGPAHPLDVDLADLVDGLLDGFQAAEVEAHLAGCLCAGSSAAGCATPRRAPCSSTARAPRSSSRCRPVPPATSGGPQPASCGWPAGDERMLVWSSP